MISTTFTLTGSLLLLHAAYSCLHFKSLLQELEIPFEAGSGGTRSVPPPDVYVECALGLLVLFVGQLLGPGAGVWQPCVTGGTTKRRPLAAPAYKSRDFDVYADRSLPVNKANKKNA